VILLPILAAAAACSSQFCEAEQAEIEAERELEIVLATAQTSAELEREAYLEWASNNQQSTFDLDEVEALARSQAAWRESMEADCALFAARFRRAVTSTVPLEMEMRCRAERLRERQTFLIERYDLSIEAQSGVDK
jgi:uncharacterized protein YecT (DUF1311 family)